MKVAIIGAGVIGLSAAYELRRRGVDVVILDREDVGQAASYGNAGWITPSLSDPVPAPGLTTQSLKMMLNPDSPFHIRPKSFPSLVPWLLKFRSHCNERDFNAGLAATLALNDRTIELFDALKNNGVEFEMHETGLIRVALSQHDIDYFEAAGKQFEGLGYFPARTLNQAEIRDLEPSLSTNVVGGVWFQHERHVRPDTLTDGLLKWLKNEGVEFRTFEPFVSRGGTGRTVNTIRTDKGDISADAFLIAAGAWSGEIARAFGVNIPMRGGIGYSITMDQKLIQAQHSMYLGHARVAVTPFDGQIRFAGTMELATLNAEPNPRRIQAIRRSVTDYFTDWQVDYPGKEWMGIRPMSADGLPVIGKSPKQNNVYIATGHAMLGITLAPVTGLAVAELMTEGTSTFPLDAFSPARFG